MADCWPEGNWNQTGERLYTHSDICHKIQSPGVHELPAASDTADQSLFSSSTHFLHLVCKFLATSLSIFYLPNLLTMWLPQGSDHMPLFYLHLLPWW